jgi:23S rRNA (adenine2030-N6)-methyltransferase
MNYRHAYHAGNFADVFKHIVLLSLIQALHRKDTACCYLDTHAGCGIYDLNSEASQTTHEYQLGIGKLLTAANPPQLVKDYLACIPHQNKYPGSPEILRACLRPQDRLLLCELHAADYTQLNKNFRAAKRVTSFHQDGWQGLKAFLPPLERRGLVLIDPPYERANELQTAVTQLQMALKRWETGVFALWYPIKFHLPRAAFYRALKTLSRPVLLAELCVLPEDGSVKLAGSGMAIVNPPWQVAETLQAVLPWLQSALNTDRQGK